MNSHAKHTVSAQMSKIDSLNTFTTSVKCITPLNIFFLFYAHFQISFKFDQCVYRSRVSSRDQWNFRIFRVTNNIFVKGIYNCLNTLVELCISYTFFLLLLFLPLLFQPRDDSLRIRMQIPLLFTLCFSASRVSYTGRSRAAILKFALRARHSPPRRDSNR